MSDNNAEAYAKTAEKALGDAAAAKERKATVDPAGREALRGDMNEIFTMMIRADACDWEDWLGLPLMESISTGNMKLFTKLVDAGADLVYLPYMHVAIKEGNHEMLSMLLARGADKEGLDTKGKTPLLFALQSDQGVQAAKTLLAAGARVDTSGDRTVLAHACSLGDAGIMQSIIDRGVDVNEVRFMGESALHHAAQSCGVCAIDVLVKAGGDIELTSCGGRTPLQYAVQGKPRIDVMLCLLRHGACPTAVDDMGDSPLHFICDVKIDGIFEAADLLLRWGADETAENHDGQTPGMMLDVAFSDSPATTEELQHTRALLARAPADRAWRRRGWLVMLRKRSAEGRKRCGDILGVGGLRSAGEWLLTVPEGLFCAVLGFL